MKLPLPEVKEIEEAERQGDAQWIAQLEAAVFGPAKETKFNQPPPRPRHPVYEWGGIRFED